MVAISASAKTTIQVDNSIEILNLKNDVKTMVAID